MVQVLLYIEQYIGSYDSKVIDLSRVPCVGEYVIVNKKSFRVSQVTHNETDTNGIHAVITLARPKE